MNNIEVDEVAKMSYSSKKSEACNMKKLISFTISFIIMFTALPIQSFNAESRYTADDFYKTAVDIIEWKKSQYGIKSNEFLICEDFLKSANTTAADWYVIGMSRLEIEDNYSAYLATVKNDISEKYKLDEKLSSSKATEWHRAILTVNACKGNSENLLGDGSINLVADGIYNRGLTISLGKQGINGWVWGLIALDTMNYSVPKDSYYSRDDIITEIISRQLPDGGFSLTGNNGDANITAMVLQSLAPYYTGEKQYSYIDKSNQKEITVTISEVIDKSIDFLSTAQLETGGYMSGGADNAESIAQVIIALCSLGIDVQTDERFIKNGNNMIDALFRFHMNDRGFIHSFEYDTNSPEAKPEKSNSMTSGQVLLAMAALYRYEKNISCLYDFSDINFSEDSNDTLTQDDILFIEKPLESMTMTDYIQAVTIKDKLENTDDINLKSDYKGKINEIISYIEKIKNEISSLNNDIYSCIYPIDEVNLFDKKEIDELISRYDKLNEIDKNNITYYDDLLAAKAKADTDMRTVIITVILIVVAVIGAAVILTKIRLRKKRNSMEALEELYKDE